MDPIPDAAAVMAAVSSALASLDTIDRRMKASNTRRGRRQAVLDGFPELVKVTRYSVTTLSTDVSDLCCVMQYLARQVERLNARVEELEGQGHA